LLGGRLLFRLRRLLGLALRFRFRPVRLILGWTDSSWDCLLWNPHRVRRNWVGLDWSGSNWICLDRLGDDRIDGLDD
jgi:hypothetical protein